MEKVIDNHQLSLQTLAGFEQLEKLGGSTRDAGGKMLVMKSSLDANGHVTNTFEVWSNTNIDMVVEANTRLLERALDKYNSL